MRGGIRLDILLVRNRPVTKRLPDICGFYGNFAGSERTEEVLEMVESCVQKLYQVLKPLLRAILPRRTPPVIQFTTLNFNVHENIDDNAKRHSVQCAGA